MSTVAHAPTLAVAHPATAVTPARLMATTSASATSSPFLTPLSQPGTQSAVNALALDQFLSPSRYTSIIAGNSITPISTHSYLQTSTTATPATATSMPLTQYLPGQYIVTQNPNSGMLSTLVPTYALQNPAYISVQHPQAAQLIAHSRIGIPQSANSIPFINANQQFSSNFIPITYTIPQPQPQRPVSGENAHLSKPLSALSKSSPSNLESGASASPTTDDSTDFKGTLPVSASTSESGAIVLQTTVPADLKKPHTLTLYLGKPNEMVPCYEAKLLDTQTEPVISRVKRACNHCKQAKTKCDKHRPCRRCRHTGRAAQCTDSVHKKRGRKRPDAFLEELQKLEKYQDNDTLLMASVK